MALRLENMAVSFDTNDGRIEAVKGVSLEVKAGECLGIVGESGSGKSQTFLGALGLLASNGSVSGSAKFNRNELLRLSDKALADLRGDGISMIFQDPLTSLTPHMTVMQQLLEVLNLHQSISRRAGRALAMEWLQRVQISDAAQRSEQYPHQLSGGMRQRVMIAMAMISQPQLLIADEPTTALDVTVQSQILQLMSDLQREQGTALAMITHDMGVVARMCDRAVVMRYGEIVEEGEVEQIFYRAQHPYTRMLIDAMPRLDTPSRTDTPGAETLLEVKDLSVHFPLPGSMWRKKTVLRAVDGIDLQLRRGECLGVVGESGSGKSTLVRAILQLQRPKSGSVVWLGSELTQLHPRDLKPLRQDLQIVFQDPLASLNPRLTIGQSIDEPLAHFRRDLGAAQRLRRVVEVMHEVGLDPRLLNRYPHELSGGQNQRAGIARAVICEPKLLVCDEAVSALDVSVQAQIMTLIKSLQSRLNLAVLFISHDLSVVKAISHRIMVMYMGRVVESAQSETLFNDARHPYTRQLIDAVPHPDPQAERARERVILQGEPASPSSPLAHLHFLPSKHHDPDYIAHLQQVGEEHWVAEHD